jgi:predicted amidophosphoribosyltransferase
LARELAAAFAYPINFNLQRNKYAQPQAELNGRARIDNIRGSFFWASAENAVGREEKAINLEGKTIILIDDVATTGATLNEAAAILKKFGVKKVYGLVLAKG